MIASGRAGLRTLEQALQGRLPAAACTGSAACHLLPRGKAAGTLSGVNPCGIGFSVLHISFFALLLSEQPL